MRKIALATAAILMSLGLGVWSLYRWTFPYGPSHSCDIGLKFALDAYADDHGGIYPAGQPTPEASLSLLYPKYTDDPELLRGKTVPFEKVQQILASGKLLDEDSCGWHYVEGLTKSDNRRLAIFWDKVGLGHHGQRLWEGGHSVVFVDDTRRVVSAEEWPQFLEQQAKLLKLRDEQAINGQPALNAKIRHPSGELVDHFEGAWQLERTHEDANGKGFARSSGPGLTQSLLRWYRNGLREGRTTYVLSLSDRGWRSKPVTVEVRNGTASPSAIVFAMEEPASKPRERNGREVRPAEPEHQQPPSANPPESGRAPRDRQEFSKAMAKLREGMPEKEVLAILGRPDDVRTQYDPGGISTYKTKEIWCYGTNGHLTFPTLGSVYIDRGGNAQYIFGGRGSPPSTALFSEDELRELLRLIDKAPGLAGGSFDPWPVIQIVNAIQPLGKEKALTAIDEYLRVASHWHSDAREGLFVVLRVLFEIPEDPGYMPAMLVGEPSPLQPKDPTRLPRFPAVVLDDIPLLLVHGYTLAGAAQPIEEHVDYFRKNGRLRSERLHPTDAPLSVFERFQASFLWVYGQDSWDRQRASIMIINQLLRLVDSVYRREPDWYGNRFYAEDDWQEQWKILVGEFGKREVRWDERKGRYTFKDGSTLSDPPVKHYPREIWKLDGVKGEALLILERHDKRYVNVSLEWSGPAEAKLEPATIHVYAIANKSKPLAEISVSSIGAIAGETAFSTKSRLLELREGELVQVELSIGKETKVSPVYRP
jgi:hypothetical protein